jgi:hypothetical protein
MDKTNLGSGDRDRILDLAIRSLPSDQSLETESIIARAKAFLEFVYGKISDEEAERD